MAKKTKSNAKPTPQSAAQKPTNEDGVTYSNVPDSDGGLYHVSEVIKVILSAGVYDHKIECLNSGNSQNGAWAIDSMLIDEEMMYLEDEEADAMYL